MNRRSLFKNAGLAAAAALVPGLRVPRALAQAQPTAGPLRLSLNENPFGPSQRVAPAISAEFARLDRYSDPQLAAGLTQAIVAYDQIGADSIVLGELFEPLGAYLAQQGGAGGEIVSSTPGYTALVDAASSAGGRGVAVPLNARGENDLPALAAKITPQTRALYLVNPHNPTGTLSAGPAWMDFLRQAAAKTLVVVDEAYIEYTADFPANSAATLTREGANVLVMRTFSKMYGLGALPFGYALAPRALADSLKKAGAAQPEMLGRLNIVAAQAALGDREQVTHVRTSVAAERARWFTFLDAHNLLYTQSQANFVFFNTGRPYAQFAQAMLARGVDIGRAHPPEDTWARITIGLPEENSIAQTAVATVLGFGGTP